MSEQELNQHPDIDPSSANAIPPEQPPGGRPKQDWLHTVARATETVAPLVARQAPKVEDIPEDRRGRLATVLAIVGILMAVFQFMVQFYDLVTRPLAPLMGALTWGGWLAYEALRPPAGYRILVSEFDGSKARDYIDFGQRIATRGGAEPAPRGCGAKQYPYFAHLRHCQCGRTRGQRAGGAAAGVE